jgi:RHS repeat-associated protein
MRNSYSFDTAGRLSQILYQKGTTTLKSLQYSFDVADQLKQITGVSASPPIDSTVTSTSLNTNNQYLNVNGNNLQHDQNGNLSANAQTTYQWDVRDRLIGLSGAGVTASFSYDALGRRRTKTINGTTTTFQYDGADILRDSTATYLHGSGIDDVLSRTIASGNEYFLKDHLGSTIALTDPSGNLSTQYAYSAYRKATKTGSSTNYFTYTGREDDSTGFYFYRARYYSPDLKRFVSEDPIGFAGGQSNLYGYVGGNPLNSTDPSGLITVFQTGINSESGTLGKALGYGPLQDKYLQLPSTQSRIPQEAGKELYQNIQSAIDAGGGLKRGEPINIVGHSDGDTGISTAVDLLRAKYGDRVQINVVELDATGTIFAVPQNCDLFVIRSNSKFPIAPDDFGARLPFISPEPNWAAKLGVDHNGLLYDPATIQKVLSRFPRR